MFYDILDKKRIDILPLLQEFKEDFYLGGGTGLALQIGHRDSNDFDFFSSKEIDTVNLFSKIKEVFSNHSVLKIQEEKNTLSVMIDETIKLSFFTFPYDLIEKMIDEPYLNIASVLDIACMKTLAIIGRATNKDYIDLYYILQTFSLSDILESTKKKFKDVDGNLVLKSLVYFDDVIEEPILFKNNKEISILEIKKFFQEEIKKTYA